MLTPGDIILPLRYWTSIKQEENPDFVYKKIPLYLMSAIDRESMSEEQELKLSAAETEYEALDVTMGGNQQNISETVREQPVLMRAQASSTSPVRTAHQSMHPELQIYRPVKTSAKY